MLDTVDIESPGADEAELRTALTSLALGPVISITTGASPVTITPVPGQAVYEITSGGTGGEEVVLLDDFALDDNDRNASMIWSQIVFTLASKTNPGDNVKIRRAPDADQTSFYSYDVNGTYSGYADDLILSAEGNYVKTQWVGFYWSLDLSHVDSSTQALQSRLPMPEVPNYRDAVLVSQSGTPMFIRDPGMGYMDEIPVSGADPIFLDERTRNSFVTTGGTGSEAGAILASNSHAGLRHLVVLLAKGDAGDTFSLNPFNIQTEDGAGISSIVFDTVGQWLLLECWDEPGTVWRVVRGTATVTPA